MSENSKIEWTDHTFNPWIGCTKVSPGCAHCYAETLMDTRRGRAQWGKGKPRVRTVASTWNEPRKWNRKLENQWICTCGFDENYVSTPLQCPKCKERVPTQKRQRVFCASLCDVFDDEVPIEWLADLLGLIDDCKNLDWQLLTKRPENIASRMDAAMHGNFDRLNTFAKHMPHVWLGTSVENQEMADQRIPALQLIPASVHFLSCEPLLGPVDLKLGRNGHCLQRTIGEDLHWIICGGESGPGARPMDPAWARSLRDQANAAGVAFHFKQWGGVNKKTAGRELDGRTWDELPTPRLP